jgi:hypothetical protein
MGRRLSGSGSCALSRASTSEVDPRLRQRIGEAGRRAVFPRYDIAELVAHLRSLYAQLLANRSAITSRSLAVKDNPIHL